MATITGQFRIQIRHESAWKTHSRTRGLALAQEIARHLQAAGHTVRILRTILSP